MKINKKLPGITQTQTLLIVGIVFLIIFMLVAVPFFASYKKKQTVAKVQSVYAALLNANKNYVLSTGGDDGVFDTTLEPQEFSKHYFEPYLAVKETCNETGSNCWQKIQYTDLNENKYMNLLKYGIVLTNGTVIGFYKDKSGQYSLVVDIDGKAGVNRSGRDVFIFGIYNEKNKINLCEESENAPEKVPIKDGLHVGGFDRCGVPFDEYSNEILTDAETEDGCNKKGVRRPDGLGLGTPCAAVLRNDGWAVEKNYPW